MDIRKIFYKIYGVCREVITPTLKYSQYLYEDIIKLYINPNIKWLDLGCGSQILPPWRSQEEKHLIENCRMVVGIDNCLNLLKNHKNIVLKVKGDITNLPFKNNSFDLATANMVVEHLDNPEVQLHEINRILKRGGFFIFHTPNIFGYSIIMGRLVPNILKSKLVYLLEGRKNEDIFATYYRANSSKRIKSLAKKNGFEVLEIRMIVSSALFKIIPLLVIFELIWIRILMIKPFKPLRTNIIAILKKQ